MGRPWQCPVWAPPGKQARASGDGHDPQGPCCGPCPSQTRLCCSRLSMRLAPSTWDLRNPLVSAYLRTPTPCQRETRLRARLCPPSPHWWAVAASRGCCSAREGVPNFPHCPQGLWVTEIKQSPWQAESSTALLEWAPWGGEQSPSALTQQAALSLPPASSLPPSGLPSASHHPSASPSSTPDLWTPEAPLGKGDSPAWEERKAPRGRVPLGRCLQGWRGGGGWTPPLHAAPPPRAFLCLEFQGRLLGGADVLGPPQKGVSMGRAFGPSGILQEGPRGGRSEPGVCCVLRRCRPARVESGSGRTWVG